MTPPKGSTLLLATAAFSCFSDRSWSFVVPVVLSRTCPQQSTFFSSVYSFAELLFVMAFSSPVSLSLARRPRITAYKLSIIVQNVLTAVACAILAALVLLFINSLLLVLHFSGFSFVAHRLWVTESGSANGTYDSRKDWVFDTCFAVLCVAGGFAAVLSSCAKVLLAKDMLHAVKHESVAELVAMEELPTEGSSDGTEEKEEGMVLTATEESPEFQHQYDVGLARANRTFSFIDLSMAVVAPILVGLICDSVFWKKDDEALDLSSSSGSNNNSNSAETRLLMNTLWAAVFVGAWNIVSCVPETLVPGRVATKHQLTELFQPQNAGSANEQDDGTPSTGKKETIFTSFRDLFQQQSILALFAFSMLWCTILSPSSSPLVAYLVGTRHFSSLLVSVFAAVSQVIGTLGLTVPPVLVQRRWAPVSVAMLGFTIQLLLLTVCVACFGIDFGTNYHTPIALVSSSSPSASLSSSSLPTGSKTAGLALLYAAMGAMALSRFGLWMGDNAMQLILQKTVPLDKVCSVNGALQALYSFWSALALVVSIFTPVSLFMVAVGFSYAVVFISILIFSVYFVKNPKKTA